MEGLCQGADLDPWEVSTSPVGAVYGGVAYGTQAPRRADFGRFHEYRDDNPNNRMPLKVYIHTQGTSANIASYDFKDFSCRDTPRLMWV